MIYSAPCFHTNLRAEPSIAFEAEAIAVSAQINRSHIRIQLSGPCAGWFLVGFHQAENLQNARLFFVRFRNGTAEVEEHRTNFKWAAPFHKIAKLGSQSIVILRQKTNDLQGSVVFNANLSGELNSQVDFGRDKNFYVTLAYSHSKDFYHHSHYRTHGKVIIQ